MYQKEQKSRSTSRSSSKSRSRSNSSSQEKKVQVQKSKKQTHLGAVASSSKDKKPELAVEEIHHRNHGEEAHDKSSNRKQFEQNYREPQIKYNKDRGGAGFDEEVRTTMVAEQREHLKGQGIPDKKIKKDFVGNASEQRVPVVNEVWSTGDPKQPLGGHPGGLSKDQKNMRKGLTTGHNPKDNTRKKYANRQLEEGLGKTEHDLKEATEDTKLTAGLITTNQFMQPAEQMNQVDVSSSEKDAYSAKYGAIIKGQEKQPGAEQLINDSHNDRERRKINSAHALKEKGYEKIVAPEMRELVDEHSSPESAINATYSREQSSDNSNRPAESQAFQGISVDKDPPKTLSELKDKGVEAVSPPRSPKLRVENEDSGA